MPLMLLWTGRFNCSAVLTALKAKRGMMEGLKTRSVKESVILELHCCKLRSKMRRVPSEQANKGRSDAAQSTSTTLMWSRKGELFHWPRRSLSMFDLIEIKIILLVQDHRIYGVYRLFMNLWIFFKLPNLSAFLLWFFPFIQIHSIIKMNSDAFNNE